MPTGRFVGAGLSDSKSILRTSVEAGRPGRSVRVIEAVGIEARIEGRTQVRVTQVRLGGA